MGGAVHAKPLTNIGEVAITPSGGSKELTVGKDRHPFFI